MGTAHWVVRKEEEGEKGEDNRANRTRQPVDDRLFPPPPSSIQSRKILDLLLRCNNRWIEDVDSHELSFSRREKIDE